MSQYMRIFSKYVDKKQRFWTNVSDKVKINEKDEEYISCPISVIMSDDAKKLYNKNCEDTSNKEIEMCNCEVTDFWLKCVAGTDDNFIVLFVNTIKIKKD